MKITQKSAKSTKYRRDGDCTNKDSKKNVRGEVEGKQIKTKKNARRGPQEVLYKGWDTRMQQRAAHRDGLVSEHSTGVKQLSEWFYIMRPHMCGLQEGVPILRILTHAYNYRDDGHNGCKFRCKQRSDEDIANLLHIWEVHRELRGRIHD